MKSLLFLITEYITDKKKYIYIKQNCFFYYTTLFNVFNNTFFRFFNHLIKHIS